MASPVRRRLPVINSPSSRGGGPDDTGEPRPPWHWVGFGAVAIFAVWLPLTYVAQALSSKILGARFGIRGSPADIEAALAAMPSADLFVVRLILVAPHLVALALASLSGGFLVGRFGATTRVREAALAGAATASFALILSCGSAGAVSPASLTALVLATGFAALGGRIGIAKRKPW